MHSKQVETACASEADNIGRRATLSMARSDYRNGNDILRSKCMIELTRKAQYLVQLHAGKCPTSTIPHPLSA